MKKLTLASLFLSLGFLSYNAYAILAPTLRFATEATYPPFEFIAPTGQMQGFDIELIRALCKQAKTTCTFSNQPWDSLIPSLKLGKFDALVGGMNITEARKQQVDFTEPYYTSSASFVTLVNAAGEINTDNLTGKVVGIQIGTTLQGFLQHERPEAKIKTYASQQDAFLDLTSGRVDVVLGDTPMVKAWLKTNDANQRYAIVGQPIVNANYFGAGYGIAVKKGNGQLLDLLNQALKQIKANGDYEKIVKQYFSK